MRTYRKVIQTQVLKKQYTGDYTYIHTHGKKWNEYMSLYIHIACT